MDNNKQNDKVNYNNKSKNAKRDSSQDKSIKSGPLFQNPFKNEQ